MYYVGQDIEIPVSDATLRGSLFVPNSATAIVVIVLEASPINYKEQLSAYERVVSNLQTLGFATLVISLVENTEFQTSSARSTPVHLADRMQQSIDWLSSRPETRDLDVGYCGLGRSGAVVALCASKEPFGVAAIVVSPDFAGLTNDELAEIRAATLVIAGVGQDDFGYGGREEQNRHAMAALRCKKEFRMIFSENESAPEPPASTATVASAELIDLLRWWFSENLVPRRKRAIG